MKRIFCFLSLFLMSSAAFSAETGKCMMWKVEDKNSFVYIIGSIHVAGESFYPLNKAYYDAYDDTECLAVEADNESISPFETQKILADKGMYKNGKTLQSSISQKTLKAYNEYLISRGMNPDSTTNLRPWFLSITLLVLELQKLGFDPGYGIDRHFMSMAKKDGKDIIELESAVFQLELLSGFSDKLQDLFLFYSLKDIAELKTVFLSMLDAWKEGDSNTLNNYLNEVFVEEPALKPLQQKLFFDRNIGFAEKIEKFLNDDKLCLVVIGAGHLAGKGGVIDLLGEKGFKHNQVAKK
jgi:hypothetical protein